MSAKTKKKFRIEIQQEQYLAQFSENSDEVPLDPNMAAHRETLQAVHALRQGLSGSDGVGQGPDTERIIQEKVMVESELKLLSKALDDTKKEIAGLRYSAVHGDRIVSMNHQLDAIIDAAEDATNTILSAAEIIDNDLQKLQQKASDEDDIVMFESLGEEVIKIYEACNFQDLTGQRITKVIDTLKHVEERVDAMIVGLGGGETDFAELVEPEAEEDSELEGPQRSGEGISQEDIDALFD